ncbi:MAG: hypothetical protein KAS32_29345 [Candidatus Peribacteraceae bacterium]|nr:hypothetical protein [Candidatus Peribacteraceae bacterium]
MEKPKLNDVTKSYLAKFRGVGIEPTDEEIIWIYQLGEIALKGVSESRLVLDVPIRIKGIDFYMLTVGAETWLREVVAKRWPDNENMHGIAFLYASSNCRKKGTFNFSSKYTAMANMLITWGLTLLITNEESRQIVKHVIGEVEEDVDSKASSFETQEDAVKLVVKAFRTRCDKINIDIERKTVLGTKEIHKEEKIMDSVAYLQKVYGKDRDYWLWEISAKEFREKIKYAVKMDKDMRFKNEDVGKSEKMKAHDKLNEIWFNAKDGMTND